MNLHLKNKAAIVTGAGAGIGKAIALGLAKEGADVAISGRDRNSLEQTAKEIASATDRRVLAVAGDMTQADSVKHLVDAVVADFTTVHILVINVGETVRGWFSTIDSDMWESSLAVNLMSAVYASQRVVPYMKRQKWGRIISIAALSATEPNPALAASNAAKSGLLSLSKTLSRELAADNILVNCVSPGLIESPQNDRYFSEPERKAAVSTIPLNRFGRPEEFAGAVTFLCSDRVSYITGINMIIDGGAGRAL